MIKQCELAPRVVDVGKGVQRGAPAPGRLSGQASRRHSPQVPLVRYSAAERSRQKAGKLDVLVKGGGGATDHS